MHTGEELVGVNTSVQEGCEKRPPRVKASRSEEADIWSGHPAEAFEMVHSFAIDWLVLLAREWANLEQ